MSFAEAVIAVLTSALPASITVYDAAVAGHPPASYVVVYIGSGLRKTGSIEGLARDQDFTFQITSAASWPDATTSAAPECRALAEAVRDTLINWVATVPGMVFGPVVHVNSRLPIVDEQISDRHLVYAVDEFSVLADRAT